MLGLSLLGLLSTLAFAQNPTPTTPVSENLISIERAEFELAKKYKNASARKLKRAWDALDHSQFTEARKAAAVVSADPLFGDLALWLQAMAERGLAEKAPAAAAVDHARSARTLWGRIEDRYPLSPALRQMDRERGTLELIEARALSQLKKDEAAFSMFENGFNRLFLASLQTWMDRDSLDAFGALCKRFKNAERCQPWWIRFSLAFNKISPESKVLQKYASQVGERPRAAPGVGRGSTTYKAPDLDNTAFDAAMKAYQEASYGKAVQLFRQFLDDYPRSGHRHRARFWLAQALVQEQEHEQATRTFESLVIDSPLSYYGLASALATGRNVDATISPTVPDVATEDPNLFPAEVFHLKRTRALLAEKALALASLEMREFRPREIHSSPFLAYMALLSQMSGNSLTAFSILSELINRGYENVLTSAIVRIIFPMRYWDLIKKYSEEWSLDPVLVLSLIKQESAFDSTARSGVGATGLMQIMPQTALETDSKIDLGRLGDPEVNIRTGTRYLKQLLNKFNGNTAYALAGYNAGPNAVDRWTKDASGKRGVQEFIESIPYRETREYVAGIIRNYYWYSRRISGEFPKTISQFWGTYGPQPQ